MTRRGAQQIFTPVARQVAPSPPLTDSVNERASNEVVVVGDQKELGGADAVFFVLRKTGAWWVWPLALPPLVWLMRVGYRVVARNRGYISQKYFGGQACDIPRRPKP